MLRRNNRAGPRKPRIIAMASGIPVVASAAGGVFSLISDMETGLIVPKRNVADFADKIQVFLNDPSFAERIGMNGFKYVQENFPFQRTLEKTLELYQLAKEVPIGA